MNSVFARMYEIMKADGLSQGKMAEILGVSNASVSHMINGRNNPGIEVVKSFSRSYPSIDMNWLIKGVDAGPGEEDNSSDRGGIQNEVVELIRVYSDGTFSIVKPRS